MIASAVWCAVVLGTVIGTSLTIRAFEGALPEACKSWTSALRCAGLSAVALFVLALLWRVRAIASADGSVVAEMAHQRTATMNVIMSVVTTVGDVVPIFAISAVLALLIHLQGRHRLLAWTLPLLVMVELVVQISFGKVLDDVTIAQVEPGTPLGGFGTIPSGSVARLLSVFLVAAVLWGDHSVRGAQRLTALGGSLVLVQAFSRLYLGRHLIADIAGGLLLGLILAICAAWLLRAVGVGLAPLPNATRETSHEGLAQ